ncbi:TIGR01777 family protein [Oceanobacillus piezotolerans]|uniref:TIGR01777 family protein n=1 Tax=Oceanobacillus piezotolerans TaxID=2448030 RepID=A0A498D188_9BACI|nr:TIGR01777 family oxidoreductase [Oceanobacillus piezotolerans]RLL40345.1 TIGR01777 family protein [Oceanobacillus piezotolerans]
MNFLLTGGTGFVGKKVTEALHDNGHHTFIITRTPDKYENTEKTTYIDFNFPMEELPLIYGVINLAGESLFGYWTEKKKEAILSSRISITNKVIDTIKRLKEKPKVFINGSAVGFYGNSNELIFTEATKEAGSDFLADVVVKWEAAAKQAEELGIRTVYSRFGIILGHGGSLPLMSLPIKLFAGGKIGSGEQWLSWIHIDDVVRLMYFCLFHEDISGAVNFTAPKPKRNKEFMKTLAAALKRPYWLTTPSFVIQTVTGETGQLITKGQYVIPQKALDHQFQFSYPELKIALEQIFNRD